MVKKDMHYGDNAPPWARYSGEKYVSGFSGTKKQKKEHDKIVAELLGGHKKHHRHRRKK